MNKANGGKGVSADATEDCLNDFQKRFEKKLRDPKFAVDVGTFIVLLAYAAFTGAMYFVNRNAADAATRAAIAAEKSVTQASINASLDQRAWVGVSNQLVDELSARPSMRPLNLSIAARLQLDNFSDLSASRFTHFHWLMGQMPRK